MENHQLVLVLDFGGQYNQLIARRVRECNVYCEVMPYNHARLRKSRRMNPIGIIFTGGPNSVYEEKSPQCDPEIFELGSADPGHLLRLPADGAHPGRQGHRGPGRHCARIRQDRDLLRHAPASCSRACRSRVFPG